MRKKDSSLFPTLAALLSILMALGQPAVSIAEVAELTLTKVPADTKVMIVGDDRLDRVEARTPIKDSNGQLVMKLSERAWPSGKYILNIWEPVGSPVSELITLNDGANQLDLSTILGEPASSAIANSTSSSSATAIGAVAGATLPGIVVGGGGGGRIEPRVAPRNEEWIYPDRERERDERDSRRGGGRAGAGIAAGTAIVGALLGSLFSKASNPPPAAAAAQPAQPTAPATPPLPAEFVADRVLATIPLADQATMLAQALAIAADHNVNLLGVNALDSINLGLVEYVILDGLTPIAKSAELAADPRVESAQPEYIYLTTANQDQLYYGPRLIRADSLPTAATGKGIKVAVIDTGVDVERAEIKGKVVENVDMTGKGLSADVHGTMVAGIIMADRNSGIGVAPSASLLAVKSCQPQIARRIEGICWTSTLTRGIDFANTKGARVINLSVGGPQDKLLARLVGEAVKRSITVVASAGNDGAKGQPRYPAALDNVVAVTAIDIERRLFNQATRGGFIDVAAPGVDIVSIGPGARFPISSGTSFSAAYVSAIIALLLEQRGSFTPQELQAAIEKASRDLGAPGKDEEFGSGLVDICQAMAQLELPAACR